MIKVMLRGGKIVNVPEGEVAIYKPTIRECHTVTEEVVANSLEIKAKDGETLASFDADEVMYFIDGSQWKEKANDS